MGALMRFPTVTEGGVVTHVMVPVAEYEKLTGEHPAALQPPSVEDVNAAIAVWNDKSTEWHDAEAMLVELVRGGIETIRRSRGMTQTDLGRASGLSQSQVSRIESAPDTASLGVLRRIAVALAQTASRQPE